EHLNNVAVYFSKSCLEIPEIYQMDDQSFQTVVASGLIASWLHDKQQMESGEKSLHGEISAITTFIDLLDLGVDPEIAYTTATCIYYHTFEKLCSTERGNFYL